MVLAASALPAPRGWTEDVCGQVLALIAPTIPSSERPSGQWSRARPGAYLAGAQRGGEH